MWLKSDTLKDIRLINWIHLRVCFVLDLFRLFCLFVFWLGPPNASVFWPPDAKSWLIGKDPNAGKDGRQKKWTAEDEMVGWHHWLNGREFEQALGDSGGQGNLAHCSPWDHKESDRTYQLHNNNLMLHHPGFSSGMLKNVKKNTDLPSETWTHIFFFFFVLTFPGIRSSHQYWNKSVETTVDTTLTNKNFAGDSNAQPRMRTTGQLLKYL